MTYDEWKQKYETIESASGIVPGIDSSVEEYCWQTGNYLSDCDCEFCYHKFECSGSDFEED